jgi:hypothetical protein
MYCKYEVTVHFCSRGEVFFGKIIVEYLARRQGNASLQSWSEAKV